MDNNNNYLNKFIPNFITILSLCCGLSSIRYSILSEWKIAILLIIFAGIFDFFDGWFAKKLKGNSIFGAELDSLSDVISFGVAPSILIYSWTLSDLKSLGWSLCLFFVVCSALRLARFTTDINLSPKKIDSKIYFTGVPSPAAAGLSLLPLFIFIEFDFLLIKNPYINLLNLGVIGFLMVSKIPTISLKNINLKNKYSPWIILLISTLCIGIISNVWLTLILISFIYIISIFYTVITNLNKTKN